MNLVHLFANTVSYLFDRRAAGPTGTGAYRIRDGIYETVNLAPFGEIRRCILIGQMAVPMASDSRTGILPVLDD